MSAPTLIDLPPPPSNPETPSELGPGTPNSGITSMSALSTTAIKDGHQGHAPPHISSLGHYRSTSATSNTLEAERADRISRLAGLERVASARQGFGQALGPNAGAGQVPGYFDGAGNPQFKTRSTVGSASATGSVGERATWAGSSEAYDGDKMSEEPDDGVSSVGALSDEGNASLVGFGEGASSTISGPVSRPAGTSVAGLQSGVGSPTAGKVNAVPGYTHPQYLAGGMSPGRPTTPTNSSTVSAERREARMIDGIAYDPNAVDSSNQCAPWLPTPLANVRAYAGVNEAGTIPQDTHMSDVTHESFARVGKADDRTEQSKGSLEK
ncbi:MAG: hypothetical protein M1829_002006 [Trizodia sp. TS-e1964]|nr:MAG: hypothetical protein M1829_002006 [Trizodia sp. TS-e1964]